MLKKLDLKLDLMISNMLKVLTHDDDPRPEPVSAESLAQKYEIKDANCLGIVLAAVILASLAVCMQLVLGLSFQNFKRHELRVEQAQIAKPEDYTHGYAPTQPLDQYRLRMNEQLHSYGWVDHDKNIVRIPIEKAMQWRVNAQ